ncbi:MAG TPA: 23S rRNA (adenine(2503)-C(2))-methyltransferase RlmN [Chloroflexi bacterium]|nr:23S rRNA (adenine(2503)-C(2))-methyltransferase RlmN [Chloroflexota bacterium]
MSNLSTLIYDLDLNDLQAWVQAQGQAAYRARQLWEGLYRHLWASPKDFTPLPKSLRAALGRDFTFEAFQPAATLVSTDGETHKTLFRLPDGAQIETVRMRYVRRRTLCISTQAGCAMGCAFCATGQMGLQRNLSAGEIVAQVLYYARWLRERGERVTHIVFMGMGEPFHNYDATLKAIDILNHPQGFALGARRMTISTVGLVPQIRRFTAEKRQVNLAISLHAADDELRSSLIPINRKYPLNALMDAVRDYTTTTHRRVTFEWALIRGLNDTKAQARRLAALLKGMLAHVNLIPLNPTQGFQGEASSHQRAREFCQVLTDAGIPCTVRLRRGIDIQAGCGQLAAREGDSLDFVLKSP